MCDHHGKFRPAPSPLNRGWAGNSELWSSQSFIKDFGGRRFYLYFFSFRKIVVSNKIIKVLTLLSKASWLIRGDLHIKIAGVVIRKFLKKFPIAVRRNFSLWACLWVIFTWEVKKSVEKQKSFHNFSALSSLRSRRLEAVGARRNVSSRRAPFLSCALYFQAPVTPAKLDQEPLTRR